MLKILRAGECFREPCTLLLGGFDGLHLGHRALLAEAKKAQLPIGITTLFGGKGRMLFTREEREFLFAQAGVAFVCEIAFDQTVKSTSAEDFAAELFSRIAAKRIVCGEDFRFGCGALGTPELLKELAPCPVEVVPFVRSALRADASGKLRTRKISTHVCKTYVKTGELSLLNACLGADGSFCDRAYFVQGVVEHGRQVGRTYGFPTLNLAVPFVKLLPPDGVYGGICATPRGNFPCIVNLGARPTFGVKEKKIEAYLDGFSGDLYGETVRVYPVEFYRGIEKFPSAEALKHQLEADIARLRRSGI